MKVNLGNYTWEEVKDLSDKDPVVLLPLVLRSEGHGLKIRDERLRTFLKQLQTSV